MPNGVVAVSALARGDSGPEVKRLQEALLELGKSLPRWGADGSLGSETLGAVQRLLDEHGRHFDDDQDVVSAEEQAFIYGLLSAPEHGPPAGLVDMRQKAAREQDRGIRPWSQVTGVCLHQTACKLGENPPRWANVGAHIGVTRGGKVIWLHDFNRIVWHGNGWNARTVGIEMDGTYAGIEGNPKTLWRPKEEPNRRAQSPTPELIEASKQTVRWICAEVARHGGRVTKLVAHRQASKDRQSDPGSALWQQVALELHRELGLDDGGPGFQINSGLPIPEAWDPSRKGIKY